MASHFRCFVIALAMSVLAAEFLRAADPLAKGEVTMALRWGESKPQAGVTVKEGVDLSCTDHKVFLHERPVLTQDDITEVTFSEVPAKPEKKYFLVLKLTRDAAKKMTASSAANQDKPLVVEVDGKIAAAMVVKAQLTDAVPITGYFTEAEALGIAKGIRPKNSGKL